MPHFGTLAEHQFERNLDDIRGSALYGVDNEKLGKIDDVIFDHASGDISYVVVDTGGWLSSKKFVVPADRIHLYDRDKDAFQVDVNKAHIEKFPPYDEKTVRSEKDWGDYEKHYEKAWNSGVVLHKEGSNRTITPEPSETLRGREGDVLRMNAPRGGFGSLGEEIEAIDEPTQYELGDDLTPHRLQGKFPDTSQSPSKIEMRPEGAREERSGQFYAVGNQNMPGQQTNSTETTDIGDVLETSEIDRKEREALGRSEQRKREILDRGPRWDRFENLLRKNRVDITAKCASCAPAKDKAA